MKKLLFFLLIGCNTAIAQNNDYVVSLDGIGAIKLGTLQVDLEKVLNKKFTLRNALAKNDLWMDTVKTKYKNIDVILYFERKDIDENNFDMALAGVSSSSPLLKTSNGIGIGSDKLKIINSYENHTMYIWPEFTDDTYSTRSKTKSVINVSNDESGNMIQFHLTNKKVTYIEVSYSYEH